MNTWMCILCFLAGAALSGSIVSFICWYSSWREGYRTGFKTGKNISQNWYQGHDEGWEDAFRYIKVVVDKHYKEKSENAHLFLEQYMHKDENENED